MSSVLIPNRPQGTCHILQRPIKVTFGDFGVSFTVTVTGRYTRRGPRLSVRGEPLLVLTRGNEGG